MPTELGTGARSQGVITHRTAAFRPAGSPMNPVSLNARFLGTIFHQELIRGNNTLHLSWVSTPVWMVLLGKRTVAAFDLLAGRVGRQPQHIQRLLALQQSAHRISAARPESSRS